MNLSELPTGVTVLVAIAVLVACLAHWRVRHFWLASLISAITTVAVFYVVCLIQAGPPEAMGLAPLALFGAFSFMVAVVIGLAALAMRSAARQRA